MSIYSLSPSHDTVQRQQKRCLTDQGRKERRNVEVRTGREAVTESLATEKKRKPKQFELKIKISEKLPAILYQK